MRRVALAFAAVFVIFAYAGPSQPDGVSAAGPSPVNSALDTDDGTCDVANCTLREAINAANAAVGGRQEITFAIPGDADEVFRIVLDSPLPAMTRSILIAGFTQSGTALGTGVCPATPQIQIEVSGENLAGTPDGFVYAANGIAVRGISIIHFAGNGIVVQSGSSHTIQCNHIGITADGTSAGNGVGIRAASTLSDSSQVHIGLIRTDTTTSPASVRNVISGNLTHGILIDAGDLGVRSNYIGLNPAGTAARGNGEHGIAVTGGVSVDIGGTETGSGNVISGQSGTGDAGITVSGGTVRIYQNFIGTNAAGTARVPNNLGVQVLGDNVFIGSSESGANGNVISGNTASGIYLREDASSTKIYNNYIGTDLTGSTSLFNGTGITVDGADQTVIGGDSSGNLISGNSGNGIFMVSGATTTSISGNLIGYQADGLSHLSNGTNAIYLLGLFDLSPSDASIGGSGAGANRIYVAGPTANNGIRISSGSAPVDVSNIRIYGNFFDTSGLGINLLTLDEPTFNTFTPNDAQDTDTGPNGLQNYPVITAAVAGDSPSISGTLNSLPNQDDFSEGFWLHFYRSSSCSDTRRTGESPLTGGTGGIGFVTTDADGNGTFTFTHLSGFTAGDYITAFARHQATGNTSEFSACFQATGDSGPSINDLEPDSAVAGAFDFLLTVSGSGFEDGDIIVWDGDELDTTFVGSTTLTATVTTNTITREAQIAPVYVRRGSDDTNSLPFTVLRSSSDVNCDGIASAEDALLVLRILAGLEANDGPCSADTLGANGVHMSDVLHVRRELAGLVAPLQSATPWPLP